MFVVGELGGNRQKDNVAKTTFAQVNLLENVIITHDHV